MVELGEALSPSIQALVHKWRNYFRESQVKEVCANLFGDVLEFCFDYVVNKIPCKKMCKIFIRLFIVTIKQMHLYVNHYSYFHCHQDYHF